MRAFYENRIYKNKLPVYVNTNSGFSFLAHWHTDVEMLFVMEGQIRLGINQEVKVLSKGDLAICPSGEIHYFDSSNMESRIILMLFHPKVIGFPDRWPKDRKLSTYFIIENDQNKNILNKVQVLLLSLMDEINKNQENSEYIILARLYEILWLVIQNFSEPITGSNDKGRVSNEELSAAHKILRYIDERDMLDLTLNMVADEFKMSPSYLSKLIKKVSGMSFLSYLTSRRMLRAEHLLKVSDKNITEISYDCGFKSVRTFNRVFKKLNGLSPSQYRKNQ